MRICWILFLVLFGFLACRKPDPDPILPNTNQDTPKLNILWQKPLTQDTAEHSGEAQYLWNGNLIYGVSWNIPSTLNMCDGSNGNLIWSFDQFTKQLGFFTKYGKVFPFGDNTLVHGSDYDYCISNITGKKIWETHLEYPNGSKSEAVKIGNYLYKVNYSGDSPKHLNSALVRSNFSTQSWDTLHTSFPEGNYYPSYEDASPAIGLNTNGDSILIFTKYLTWVAAQNAPNNILGKNKVIALNLRTRQVLWERDDLSPNGNPGGFTIENNRIYTFGQKVAYCLDLNTGATVWSNQPSNKVFSIAPVIYKNVLVIHAESTGTYGLDKNSGQVLWYNPDTDGNAFELTCFEGVVYFTSSGYARLYAIDALTGTTIWNEGSPNAGKGKSYGASFFDTPIVIDPDRKVLFIGDKYYMMCIKLPR